VRKFRSCNPYDHCSVMCLIFARLFCIRNLSLDEIEDLGIPRDGPYHRRYQYCTTFHDWLFFGFSDLDEYEIKLTSGGQAWDSIFDHMINTLNAVQNDTPGCHFQIGTKHNSARYSHATLLAKRGDQWIYFDPNCGCYYFSDLDELKTTMVCCFHRTYKHRPNNPGSEFYCQLAYAPDPWPQNVPRDQGNPDEYDAPI